MSEIVRLQELADAKHRQGYNCAQAVACAFSETLGRDEKEIFTIMEGFGFGMGCMSVCGAVSAMTAVAGMKESDCNLDKPGTKRTTYGVSKQMIKEFEDMNKSIICSELKGVQTGTPLRSCPGCISDAVAIVGKYLDL